MTRNSSSSGGGGGGSSCKVQFNNLNCTGPYLPAVDRSIILTIITVSIVATVLGNLLIVGAVASSRQLRTRANALALSLAVSDLLIGLLIMPVRMLGTVYQCWFLDEVLCHVAYFVDYTLTTSSIFHVGAIAYDRHVAICDPLRYPARVTNRTLGLMLVLCWLGAALFTAPTLISLVPTWSRGVIERVGCPDDCSFFVSVGFHFFFGETTYLVSLVTVIGVYAKIYVVARRQARQIQANTTTSNSNSKSAWSNMKREHNAAKTLGAIIGVFMFAWLPFVVVVTTTPGVTSVAVAVALEVTMWMGYASSAVNPFLYALLNRHFRAAFRDVLCLRGATGDRRTGSAAELD
ncbi:trace amine-associated receptor 5-like [Lethenteron reissneri]|uniref:trace amine-associated receptor 5-like n=1 Tax=Lethenteron reissneri TaxID=7753 RepID=UPI002AB72B1B|nr:trace amine-associated receptor 5-like [Lethenteron reissneri]